jgi:hypothetical protein
MTLSNLALVLAVISFVNGLLGIVGWLLVFHLADRLKQYEK